MSNFTSVLAKLKSLKEADPELKTDTISEIVDAAEAELERLREEQENIIAQQEEAVAFVNALSDPVSSQIGDSGLSLAKREKTHKEIDRG